MATDDGYISTFDMEDDATEDATAEDGDVLGSKDTAAFRSIIMHRVLSTQLQQPEKLQHHNLFQTFFVINNQRACVIIDGGSCNHLVSSDFGKAKVIHTCRVSFSIGSYASSVDCDVVPIEPCSILLGHPCGFDNDATHHGQINTYTFMHKGKKITLLPLTLAEIVQASKERAASLNDTNSKNQQVAKSLYPPKNNKKIKLKGGVMLARKCDFAKISDDDICYALVCTQTLFSLDNIASSIPPVATNLLQEYEDIFLSEIPPGLPPMRGIKHQIDLIPGATLPNRAAYRTNPEETKEIQ
jgi:hypothetical protein